MSLTLKFFLDEFNKEVSIKLRESEATLFLEEIVLEAGQKLVSKFQCDIKDQEEIMTLNNNVFSLNRKVLDGIRYRLDLNEGLIDGNVQNIEEDEKAYKIVLILESPHKSEYNFSYRHYAKKPANGITGRNIEASIYDIEFWDNLLEKESNIIRSDNEIIFKFVKRIFRNPIKNFKKFKQVKDDEDLLLDFLLELGLPTDSDILNVEAIRKYIPCDKIDFYVVNRICYQTSLGSYYRKKLIAPLRNNIFKALWKLPEISDDFYDRLFKIEPDIIINASTNDLDKIGKKSFEEDLKVSISNLSNQPLLYSSNHPSRGKISNSLEKVQ